MGGSKLLGPAGQQSRGRLRGLQQVRKEDPRLSEEGKVLQRMLYRPLRRRREAAPVKLL